MVPALDGPLSARVASTAADARMVAEWMRLPHVAQTWDQAWDDERWEAEIAAHNAGMHVVPQIIELNGTPIAYLEIYRVELDRLRKYYSNDTQDLGLHIAIGPRDAVGVGVGTKLMHDVPVALLAANRQTARVAGEPRASNKAIMRALEKAGWHRVGRIQMPHKEAELVMKTRDPLDARVTVWPNGDEPDPDPLSSA